MAKYNMLVIETTAPTDSDYEMITDQAIQNTLQEYWQWEKECGANIQFKIVYPDDKQGWGYDNQMKVYAEFNNENDYKDFKLNFVWTLPKNKLDLSQENWCYVVDKTAKIY